MVVSILLAVISSAGRVDGNGTMDNVAGMSRIRSARSSRLAWRTASILLVLLLVLLLDALAALLVLLDLALAILPPEDLDLAAICCCCWRRRRIESMEYSDPSFSLLDEEVEGRRPPPPLELVARRTMTGKRECLAFRSLADRAGRN